MYYGQKKRQLTQTYFGKIQMITILDAEEIPILYDK